jgi:glycosyltransferase involved in cell wall biosynthesis
VLNIQLIQRISNDFMVDERALKNLSRIHVYFMHRGVHLADYILCQNDYQLKQITAKHPGKRVFKISNPIYQVDTSEPTNPDQRDYIAWLGLFQYQKNLKLLFEIARALPGIEFRVAGKEDPKCDAETLRYLARIAALPNVKMAGFLDRQQVFLFLSNAKYLLNTSHYEGFTNTFLEAMSAGIPIISSTKVNPDNIISSFKLGFIYDSVPELITKINSISHEDYMEMSGSGRKYLQDQHDFINQSRKLLALLDIKQCEPHEISNGIEMNKPVKPKMILENSIIENNVL